MERVRRLLFGHPLTRAVGFGLFSLLGNVLAGAYIFEITETKNGMQSLEWPNSLHSRAFWLLVIVLVLMGVYGWGAARYETRVRKALTEADVLPIALQELIGPLIEAAKKDIKENKLRTLEDVRKMFGPGSGEGGS